MQKLALCGFLLFGTLSAQAAPLRFHFSSGPNEVKKARKALDKWLRSLAKKDFPAKMRTIAQNQAISRAQFGVVDMRDAVAALPAAEGETPVRAAAAPQAPCSTLESCPARVAAVHAEGVGDLSSAVVAVVQPWVLLQHRRGGTLSLRAEPGESGTLATMTLDGLLSVPIDICASPAPMGGLEVWLRSSADLDDIYAFSREAALRSSHPQ